jgi:hypothetical protein
MKPNRFINALPKVLADLQVFRRKPTANAIDLKVGVEAIRKVLVSG